MGSRKRTKTKDVVTAEQQLLPGKSLQRNRALGGGVPAG